MKSGPPDALHVEQVRLLGLATRDMVWSWDARSDRCVESAAFAEALGEIPKTFTAASAWWRERVHPSDRERISAAFDSAVRDGAGNFLAEYRLRKRDGTYLQVDDRACFVRGPEGEIVRMLGALRDITLRKRAEEAHARFTHILESTSDLVAMATAGGLVLHLNAAGRRMLGWTNDEPVGAAHLAMLHPAWAAEILIEEGVPRAVREGTWTGETAVLTRTGEEIPVSQVIISHFDEHGNLELISTIIRDIRERKREEVARIEWANRYDAAIRASGQVLFDWNSVTNEITYGGDLDRLLGYSAGQMAGGLGRLRELIHRDDLAMFDDEVQRVIATRDPFHLSFRVQHRDGGRVYIEAKGYFFLDRQGQIGRMIGFLADITAQQQAQQQLARAQENLEARVVERTAELGQANAVIHERAMQQSAVAQLGQRALAGVLLDALFNDAVNLVRTTLRVDLCSIVKLTPDGQELAGVALAGEPKFAPGRAGLGIASQAGYTLLVRCPVIAEDIPLETRFSTADTTAGGKARSAVSVAIEADGQPVGALIAVTFERYAFTQDDVNFLQSVANVLTAAIDRHHAEERIRHAQEEAEAANRAKSEFLSRMSHELRTPLNAILGFSQLLEMDGPSEGQTESIGHIVKAGQHLLSLINEVLDIARIDSGRLALNREPVELPLFLEETVGVIRPLAARHEVGIDCDESCKGAPTVIADHQRLRQVVLNLLSNAVKFNTRGGRVFVSCARRGERARISVRDTGSGISEENLSRLFIPFERLGAEATDIEGTGIGLALSQRIVAALGGELGVTTKLGEGSTFWVELPLAQPEGFSSEGAEGTAMPIVARQRTLLYIEDQEMNQRLVERILAQNSDLQLMSATRGSQALDLARAHRPDLILLDLHLPDIPGDEVLRRLKADDELQDIPVIMISGDAISHRMTEFLQLGATDYLTKPYKVRDFLEHIEKALLKARLPGDRLAGAEAPC